MTKTRYFTVDKLIKFKPFRDGTENSVWFCIPEDFITEERAIKWFNILVRRHPDTSWRITETTVDTVGSWANREYAYTHKTIKEKLAN